MIQVFPPPLKNVFVFSNRDNENVLVMNFLLGNFVTIYSRFFWVTIYVQSISVSKKWKYHLLCYKKQRFSRVTTLVGEFPCRAKIVQWNVTEPIGVNKKRINPSSTWQSERLTKTEHSLNLFHNVDDSGARKIFQLMCVH